MSENQNTMDNSMCRKQRLKELLDIGSEIRLTKEIEDNATTIEKISQIIKETDSINKLGDVHDRAQNTTEVVMDAQVIQMSHELIGEVMHKIGIGEFSDEEWTNSLVGLVFGGDHENWSPAAEISARLCHSVRFSSSLCGSYDDEPEPASQAKERQKRSRGIKATEVQPDNINKIDKQEGNAANVMLVYRQILKFYMERNQQPIPFYQLTIDPGNFMKSVDNVFQVAFLARDKSVSIEVGDDGFPYVRPLSKKDKQGNVSNVTTQAICLLNTNLCDRMIKQYGIREPMLKFE